MSRKNRNLKFNPRLAHQSKIKQQFTGRKGFGFKSKGEGKFNKEFHNRNENRNNNNNFKGGERGGFNRKGSSKSKFTKGNNRAGKVQRMQMRNAKFSKK